MAINVNTVYRTVLSILNKEQRGYMTPNEFNRTATQVQLEIFEKYSDDLNQQLRFANKQTDVDYANRPENIDEKMAIFKTSGPCTYNVPGGFYVLPTVDTYGNTVTFYRLGTVVYNNDYGVSTEVQRLDRNDFYYTENSPLTKSTTSFPTYLYEARDAEGSSLIYINPNTITCPSCISVDFLRKPTDVRWGYTLGNVGQYVYDSTPYAPGISPNTEGSTNFEIHVSEQTEVILKILMYAGVIIRDPEIVQAAAQQAMIKDQNEKT